MAATGIMLTLTVAHFTLGTLSSSLLDHSTLDLAMLEDTGVQTKNLKNSGVDGPDIESINLSRSEID